MLVSSALSLMLSLGAVLVPPDGCAVVAVEENGRAFATCTDRHSWFVYDPEEAGNGGWSSMPGEPAELAAPRSSGLQADLTIG